MTCEPNIYFRHVWLARRIKQKVLVKKNIFHSDFTHHAWNLFLLIKTCYNSDVSVQFSVRYIVKFLQHYTLHAYTQNTLNCTSRKINANCLRVRNWIWLKCRAVKHPACYVTIFWLIFRDLKITFKIPSIFNIFHNFRPLEKAFLPKLVKMSDKMQEICMNAS